MIVVLRPGVAVHPVSEGLLFSGWASGGLMACSAGVVALWRKIEPALRGGVDPLALRGRLPAKAAAVVDKILDTLSGHDMLMPAAPDVTVPPYLGAIAPDPIAAARLIGRVRLRLAGDAIACSGIGPACTAAGLRLACAADQMLWSIHVGSPPAPDTASPDIAAVVFDHRVLVGAGADLANVTGAPAYPIKENQWALVRALVVDRVLRKAAGLTFPVVEIRAGQAIALAGDDEPDPGDLPQLPLAQQHFRGQVGAGVDQAEAAGDARRAATRAAIGVDGAAGADSLDLWIDAMCRFLVRQADRPSDPPPPDLPRTARWRRSLTRRDGRDPRVGCVTTSLGVVLALAESAGRESWGYGADPASAAEHALRGLVTTSPPAGRVAVSHNASALTALARLIGDRDRVTAAHPGMRMTSVEVSGTGMLGGKVEIG